MGRWKFIIGTGSDMLIRDLITLVKEAVGFNGCVVYDDSKWYLREQD